MDDDFLNSFYEPPPPEFEAALYKRINQPVHAQNTRVRFRLLTVFLLSILLIVVLFLINPGLQAVAQDILDFFVRARSNSFVLPTPGAMSEAAAEPTFAIEELTGCEDELASHSYRCVVGGAEASLGFDIRELPSDPQGFNFAGVFIDPTQKLVRLTYARDGSELTLKQSFGAASTSPWESTWGAVPAESVEEVQINGVAGEYVRGMFVVKSRNGTQAVWEPDAPVLRLRWREGDTLFEIHLGGLTGDDRAIGKDWMISLAESLK